MSGEKINGLKNVILAVVIGFLCGVGTIHMTIASDVRGNRVDIDHLKVAVSENRMAALDMWKESNLLIRSTIEQTLNLVNRLDTQNKLLQEQSRTIQNLRKSSP